MEVKLSELNIGNVGLVVHIGGNIAIKRHLQEAGFTLNTKVMVLKITPYKSTFLVDVGGLVKTFRKMPLSLITVKL